MKKLFLLFILCIFTSTFFGQVDDKFLDQKVNVNLSKTNLLYLVNHLAFENNIPIGIEFSQTFRQKVFDKLYYENKELKFRDTMEIKTGTLRDILNSIVKQEPEYTWEFIDGVINIYPIRSRDLILKRILEININQKYQDNSFDTSKLLNLITDYVDIREFLEKENLTFLKHDPLNRIYIYPNAKINNFYIENSNVRGILNNFVRNSDIKLWVLERTGKKNEFISINL